MKRQSSTYRGRSGTLKRYQAPVAVGTKVGRTTRGPFSLGHHTTQVSDTVTRVHGRSYIGVLNGAAGLPVNTLGGVSSYAFQPAYGSNALVFDVNPTLLGDRAAVIANTFEKYCYTSLKFTYVPQCPTTTPGSVGLVFERDPFSTAVDTNNINMLSQVMSYEHAQLTPAYVGSCVSYKRDPTEKKTWFTTSYGESISTRDSSQGQFIAYISNGSGGSTDFNGAYGFIIFDYVVDLISPTIMPLTSTIISGGGIGNAGPASLSLKPQTTQWAPFIEVTQRQGEFVTHTGALLFAVQNSSDTPYNLITGCTAFASESDYAPLFSTGTCGEILLAGQLDMYEADQQFSAGVGSPIAVGGGGANTGQNGAAFRAASGAPLSGNMACGQKLFFAIVDNLSINGTQNVSSWMFFLTLSEAMSAASGGAPPTILNGACGVSYQGAQAYNSIQLCISGWFRVISQPSLVKP